jgi:hypothetical protein
MMAAKGHGGRKFCGRACHNELRYALEHVIAGISIRFITLASLARTLLIEAAHSYRFPARIARRKLAAVDAVPEAVREIAWKAQTRLCQRYRHMMAGTHETPGFER